MSINSVPNSPIKFHCNVCDYHTSRKSQFDRHNSTDKHKNQPISTFSNEIVPQSSACFICNCGKKYKDRSGLWRHNKICNNIINPPKQYQPDPTDKELIMMLIKENSELKNIVLDVCQKIQPFNNTVNSHNVTNNKTFNLNVFLNETCKDAMNIMDFVDSLKIQLTDLEKVGKIGYVEGISNIIVKNLNSLDETKRPVHCTDTKREVMYVKDEDKWEKENENKQKMRKVIKHITHKNSKLLKEFQAKYPDCGKSDSKYSDQYNKLVIEAMGGKGDNDFEKEDKIIKNIAKEVVINKSNY
jgi:hypothetical protein